MIPDQPLVILLGNESIHVKRRYGHTLDRARMISGLRRWAGRAATFAVLSAAAACGGSSTSPTPPPSTGPIVSGITPSTGPSVGGTPVTITGQRFDAGATVTIGGVEATGVAFVSANQLTATTGARSAGAADVAVTVGGARGVLANGFTYTASGPVTNGPPVVSTLIAVGTRLNEPSGFADANEEITVTATVTDAETPAANLTYEWASEAGTFTGTGPSVRWTAPALFGPPVKVNLTVTVVDRYTGTDAAGNPVPKENRVSAVTSVSVHDSIKENGDLATAFLTDFSNSSIKAEDVVRSFYSGCEGKEREYEDVARNREIYDINSHRLGEPTVTVTFDGTCAFRSRKGDGCILLSCEWNSTNKSTGQVGVARGTCYLSSVYRESKWQLCDSDFQSASGSLPQFMQ